MESQIDAAWNDLQTADAMHGASLGFCLVDAEGGHVLAGKNDQLQLTPASIIKTVVCITALEVFGADHSFKTELLTTGQIEKGVLKGDLIIRGFGDPSLASQYWLRHYGNVFETWTTAVKSAGILTIEGDIVVDDSYFENDWLPGSTAWEDVANYYGAEARGLNVMDNTYEVLLNSGEEGDEVQVVKTIPDIPGLKFQVQAIGSSVKSDNAFIYGLPFSNERVIRGEIPVNRRGFAIKGAMPNPANWLSNRMMEALRDKGFLIFGEAKSTTEFSEGSVETVLATIQSPRLSELVKFVLSKSDNLYANILLKHIGLEQKGTGSYETGAFSVIEFWQAKGFDVEGWNLVDGSGLSRLNSISAHQLTKIIGSVTGSTESILESGLSAVSGNPSVMAKSGYIGGVRAYCGLLTLSDGRKAYFTIMANHHAGSPTEARVAIQNFLKALS
jgi:serine-type D-Ala-D-Ala carboxypeptidase/endopeptidase (penicillin-binding protein 4)